MFGSCYLPIHHFFFHQQSAHAGTGAVETRRKSRGSTTNNSCLISLIHNYLLEPSASLKAVAFPLNLPQKLPSRSNPVVSRHSPQTIIESGLRVKTTILIIPSSQPRGNSFQRQRFQLSKTSGHCLLILPYACQVFVLVHMISDTSLIVITIQIAPSQSYNGSSRFGFRSSTFAAPAD